MIILIAGAGHVGKTAYAQKLLEKRKFPYLSLDLLKMGLIRSGQTDLTPQDDRKLAPYVWNIAKEIIKTAVENGQNLIVEGIYIPFDYKKSFTKEYLSEIKFLCLVMSREYVEAHFDDILEHENVIEKRLIKEDITKEELILENEYNLEQCKKHRLKYVLISNKYEITDAEI